MADLVGLDVEGFSAPVAALALPNWSAPIQAWIWH